MARILGIDYGKVRTGLAISDETETLARALQVVEGLSNLEKEVKVIIELYSIDKIVLGISKKSDGSLGEIGELSVKFGDYLKNKFDNIQVDYFDEAMSTKEVEQYLKDMGMPLKRYKKKIDKYAAEVILQYYLNGQRGGQL
ncbi:MAG: Holliday junction resolvase RuvX [bacterium]|nr:Holliday junction resolvase RuvX [bacterium]